MVKRPYTFRGALAKSEKRIESVSARKRRDNFGFNEQLLQSISMREKKKPKLSSIPNPQKKSRYEEAVQYDTKPIQWCFKTFDKITWHDDGYSAKPFNEVGGHLKAYQGLTWANIKQKDHPVKIFRLITAAQQRLQQIQQDDVEELWRLEFTGLQRLWGIRDKDIFKVLWWDPQHKICPSTLKHT